jgi:predicted hydrocarbon binding protein
LEDLRRVKIDNEIGILSYLGKEWVLLRVEALQGMFDETVKAFGSGAYTIWYLAGKGAGKSMAKLIFELEKAASIEHLIKRVCEELTNLGWGRFEARKLDIAKGEYQIFVYNNPFARGRSEVKETACTYIKGYLEGVLEELTGKPVNLREASCIAEGAPFCEFRTVIKS